jgi:hypothetical protein
MAETELAMHIWFWLPSMSLYTTRLCINSADGTEGIGLGHLGPQVHAWVIYGLVNQELWWMVNVQARCIHAGKYECMYTRKSYVQYHQRVCRIKDNSYVHTDVQVHERNGQMDIKEQWHHPYTWSITWGNSCTNYNYGQLLSICMCRVYAYMVHVLSSEKQQMSDHHMYEGVWGFKPKRATMDMNHVGLENA